LILYADTSFLVSLYVPDANSASALVAARGLRFPLVLTSLGELEFVNSLVLRVFRKELTSSQAASALAHFRQDTLTGVIRIAPLPIAAFEEAKHLSQKHTRSLGTRTLDLLHVAAAITLHARRFYTFDRAQAKLARLLGLSVI
jgi:predicted nucleic acid-binding protein